MKPRADLTRSYTKQEVENEKRNRRETSGNETCLHEKTRAAAAPRKPKKGAVVSPLNSVVDMSLLLHKKTTKKKKKTMTKTEGDRFRNSRTKQKCGVYLCIYTHIRVYLCMYVYMYHYVCMYVFECVCVCM